jgi:hypothetical protein
MLDTRHQPAIESLITRLSQEINAKAVMLIHENGQVMHHHGWMGDNEYPAMAALVSAMIATGKTLGTLGDSFAGSPNRFSCDSEAMGLYLVSIGEEGLWLTALYDQPLNPGMFRMKVRRYAGILERLGASKADQQFEMPQNVTGATKAGAVSPPASTDRTPTPEKSTGAKSGLFTDITDEEIDFLFDGANS